MNWLTVCLALVLGVLCAWLLQYRRRPGEPPRYHCGLPVIGPATAFAIDPVTTLQKARAMHGDVFSIDLLLFRATFLLHPQYTNYFYMMREDKLSFYEGVKKFMRPIFDIGEVPQSEITLYNRVSHRGLAPSSLDRHITASVAILIPELEDMASAGKIYNLSEVWTKVVNRTNVRNFVGSYCYEKYADEFVASMSALEENGASPLALMLPKVPTPAILRCRRARNRLFAILREDVARRQKHGDDDSDILSLFISAKHENGESMQLDTIVMAMIGLFFGAFHNSVNTLSWICAHLADPNNSSHRERAEAEIDMFLKALNGRQPSYVDLTTLEFLQQCIQETHRVYFSALVPPRKVVSAFEAGQYRVEKGDYIVISPIVHHLDANIFPDPYTWNPNRFQKVNGKIPYGMEYNQFGYGAHRCTGEFYAVMIIKLTLVLLVSKYRMELVGEGVPKPAYDKPVGTFRPSQPIRVKFHRRNL